MDDLTITEYTRLVNQLDPNTIRQRLTELAGEEAALRTLLRAALARQRTSGEPVCDQRTTANKTPLG